MFIDVPLSHEFWPQNVNMMKMLDVLTPTHFFAKGSQRRTHWHKCNFTNMLILQHNSKETYPMIDQIYCKCGIVKYVCMYIHVFASCVSF